MSGYIPIGHNKYCHRTFLQTTCSEQCFECERQVKYRQYKTKELLKL